ncbi:MAG: amidohydrolase [Actinomycetes bacterium]
MHVDLLVQNANILTLDDDPRAQSSGQSSSGQPSGLVRARSLAVLGGQVVAVDDVAGLTADRVVDLQGATVVPGFGDAHNHMAWYGLALDEIDLEGVRDLAEVYRLVAERAAQLPEDAWVVGSGYDHNTLGRHPHRLELDRAAGGRAVWLKHRSGHLCTVSTETLRRAGVLDGMAVVPEGGVVVHGDDGQPTGLLEEQAQNLVVALVTPYSVEQLSRAVSRASRRYAAEGLTHVTEAGIGAGWLGKSPVELAAYQTARARGELDVRVQLMPTVDALHPVQGHPDDAMHLGLDLGIVSGLGDDRLRVGPVKMWLDGSLLGRTAAMEEPFCPHEHGRGYFQDDPDRMRQALVAAHLGGWRVAAHAIGDRAVDLALDAFEEAQAKLPRPDARHRIEHAGVTHPEQIERMARLGVTPLPQLRFLHDIGDSMVEAVGESRRDALYRHASFLRAGIRVPGSSDRPVADGRPLAGIESMVRRMTSSGHVVGPDERVCVETALRAYTVDTAWIAGEEHRLGRLTPGRAADFVVLSDDVTRVDPARIAGIEVVATFLGGLCTHGAAAVGAE